MNYYYILLVLAFSILAKQSQILLKIKESYLSQTRVYQSLLLSIGIGYIILFVSVFNFFSWIYAILIIITGFTIIPFLVELVFIPKQFNKLIESNIKNLIILIIISIIISALLLFHLF